METKKRTQAADIAEIATKLDGKVNFSSIVYSQHMTGRISTNGGIVNLEYMIKRETPDAMK